MVESKNLKLKLGLCGLALTSFLAINAHSTVHADTVNGGNANAITWDSDQDDSQVVKNETQQSQPTQNVQTKQDAQQAPVQAEQKQSTVQSVQSQQRIFQSAPKQATVQSNVQNRQSQPKVAVANVSSTQAMPNRAEKSIVRQSNAETSTVNRLNANSAYNNQANVSVKVANLDATIPTRITNPQNNQVIIHYVKTNGQSARLADQIIDVTKSGTFNYNVPAGYQLSNPKYTNTETTHDVTYTGILTESEYQNPDTISADKLKHVTFLTEIKTSPFSAGETEDNPFDLGDAFPAGSSYLTGQQLLDVGFNLDDLKNAMIYYYAYKNHPEDIARHTGTYNDGPAGKYYGKWPGHLMYNLLYPNNTSEDYNASIVDSNQQVIDKILTNLKKYISYSDSGEHEGYVITYTPESDAKYNYTFPVHDSYVFQDNSGQVQSIVGNHVNIAVTKPQNVDPNSSNCKRQAQRVIHVTFPNGVKPKSYDSITDSAGNKLTLDSNNDLTQTVTFTRSVTVDGLTGATLNQTPWQQHGAINAVTLPDIPGYTMTQTK